MPLPIPHSDEGQDEFLGRCLRDPETRAIAGDTADDAHQRQVAACFRQWRDGRKDAADEPLAIKAFGALEVKDADQGEVTAVVATLNVVDKDGDVILPGAVPAAGAKVKMSGYAHDVVLKNAPPVGKGVITEEGDKLLFRGKFYLTTERGRQAFLQVKEEGADSEWSFGFPPRSVKSAELSKDWKLKGAKRLIAGFQPREASPVFIGAGVDTGTVTVKAAAPTAAVDGIEHPAEDFAYRPTDQPSDWKLPIFDADHVRNALARWGQTDMPDAAEKAKARERLLAAAQRFTIDAASMGKAADGAVELKLEEEDLALYRRNQDACLTR